MKTAASFGISGGVRSWFGGTKHWSAILIAVTVCWLASAANAAVSGDYVYSDNGDGTVTITGYTGPGGNIAIPSELDGKTVTNIGDYAFYWRDSLTSVTIPSSVTSIGNYAFYACSSLTSVDIPNSVTSIEDSAFCWCINLTSVDIPNSVTSIGEEAFNNCFSLTSVAIPNSVTSIEDSAFCWCTSLTSVAIPNSVTGIGDYAFDGCGSLTSVAIPNSVTSIGEGTFRNCASLTSVVFEGDAPKTFGAYVFDDAAEDFCIWYHSNATGFTTPKWNGYPCYPLAPVGALTMEVSLTEGGSVSPAVGSTTEAYQDEPINIVATPNDGYEFVSWTASPSANATFANATSSKTTVTLSDDATVRASFAAIVTTFVITASAGEGGAITPSGEVRVVFGNNQSFAIVANSGYTITDALVDGVSVGAVANYTFENVTANHTISASFDQNIHVAPGSAFIYTATTAFTKKPKVTAAQANVKVLNKGSEFKAGVTALACQWTSDKVAPTTAGLVIDGAAAGTLVVERPLVSAVSATAISAGDKVTVNGKWFGSKKPDKVYMTFVDAKKGKTKKVNCKLGKPSYPDTNGKAGKSYMNVNTGESKLVFTVPKGIDTATEATLTLKFSWVVNPVTEQFNAAK